MPKEAKSYDFGDVNKVPTIDGEEFPYYVSLDPGPMVENLGSGLAHGAMHLLWIPVIVGAPMPTPPEGRASGAVLRTAEAS